MVNPREEPPDTRSETVDSGGQVPPSTMIRLSRAAREDGGVVYYRCPSPHSIVHLVELDGRVTAEEAEEVRFEPDRAIIHVSPAELADGVT